MITRYLDEGNTNDVISYRGEKLIAQSNTSGWTLLMYISDDGTTVKDLCDIDFLTNKVNVIDKNYFSVVRDAMENYCGKIYPAQSYIYC